MNGLLNFAGKYKFLSYFSCLLSGLSALIAVLPFWYIWNISVCILFSENKELISGYAWQSVIYAFTSILIYIAGLLCSHMAAFRIEVNLRGKISSLPHELIDSIESYIAHIMPDSYYALFSSFGLAYLLFRSDWRLALVSIAPVVLGFVIMAMSMRGGSVRKNIAEYHKALGRMSKETDEYVRMITSKKNSAETAFSFRRFTEAVRNYESWAVSYTNERRVPMICYTVAVNSAFLFLIAAGVGISRSGVSAEFMKNFMLAVITAPLISVRITRTLRLREYQMKAYASLRQINAVLNRKEGY